jgi:hypothetical protein
MAATSQLPLYLVDAFCVRGQPFSGNPAAVVLLTAPLPDATRQAIAAEMNQAETAFVEPQEEVGSMQAHMNAAPHPLSQNCCAVGARARRCSVCRKPVTFACAGSRQQQARPHATGWSCHAGNHVRTTIRKHATLFCRGAIVWSRDVSIRGCAVPRCGGAQQPVGVSDLAVAQLDSLACPIRTPLAELGNENRTLHFHTKSGMLSVTREALASQPAESSGGDTLRMQVGSLPHTGS